MKRIFVWLFCSIFLNAKAAERPNILMIVVDDMGWSDLGCYGGEIDTPCIDRMADQGVRFSQYHVNPMCVVTRTSLMTGHTHSQSDNYRRSLPIARLMQQAGYATSISGKWHQPGNPLDAGFDAFYGFLHGAINCWTGFDAGNGSPQIQTNRKAPAPVPEGWYSTDAFTDDAIVQINKAVEQGKPFFTYLAFNAPHSPLHAYQKDVEKYVERYEAGWEVLRNKRFDRQRKMGLIDERYINTPPNGEVRRWNELTKETQKLEARRMAAHAGMMDRLDWNVGRILDHLREKGLDENTLVIFFSDNGGAYGNGDIRTYDRQVPWDKNSIPYSSNGWSYLKNTPFRWYKSSAEEGGVSSPLIVRWPGKLAAPPGSIQKQRLHVTDLYPTFLELAGIDYPAMDGDRKLEPLYGNSMLPLWNDSSLPSYAIHDEIFWAFNFTGKGLVSGDWKISSISDGPWRLYNVQKDPCTTHDLASEMPEKLQELSDRWFAFANEHTKMAPGWKQPLKDYQEGWGFHRIRMVMSAYESAVPHMAQTDVSCDTDLTLNFSKPISFAGSAGKSIRLYAVGKEDTPIWQTDPQPGHPAEGQTTITFDLPKLKPETTYFVLTDPGWVTLGGKLAGPLNDGAYWYRFRTGK
ncbi:sulfatase-like hydrolase/transferase [Tichowtungia aerotolerans]|uniref:Sulfatase-like hydrolase/transferase n=1 Tax=Tichowtungia aerotolerans TaxID=2697043 RepID=A0A6P1M9S0_9BACT|nr:sulfatase-like hydrolase/transferase [Tichowtungia aerotolerans]QHI70677.1 sulfatase-like hydrolase/transferase [Tichowtungia aerotolerans]